ncbi:hypothetical protein ACFL2V_15955 [Pseudomonadota bacterium]
MNSQWLLVGFLAGVACVLSLLAEMKAESTRPYAAAMLASGAVVSQVNFVLLAAVMLVSAGLIFTYRAKAKHNKRYGE